MILVCVTDQESCGRLIEAGRKLADLSDTLLKVICVRPRNMKNWFGSDEVEFLFNKAKQLDAEMIIKFHDYAVDAVSDCIRANDIDVVVVGMPPVTGHSVFISGIEENFPDLVVIALDDSGSLQYVPAIVESNMDSSY